jgi:hypothetical protein
LVQGCGGMLLVGCAACHGTGVAWQRPHFFQLRCEWHSGCQQGMPFGCIPQGCSTWLLCQKVVKQQSCVQGLVATNCQPSAVRCV